MQAGFLKKNISPNLLVVSKKKEVKKIDATVSLGIIGATIGIHSSIPYLQPLSKWSRYLRNV